MEAQVVQGERGSGEQDSIAQEVLRLQSELKSCKDELDAQAAEIERLTQENGLLTQAMLNARKLCGAWESQANNSLGQIDHLKDLLEESANWQMPLAGPAPPQDLRGKLGMEESRDSENVASNPREFIETPLTPASALAAMEKQLVEANVRAANSDTCLRAVSAEILRATLISSDMKNATLPLLQNVELQLMQLLRRSPVHQGEQR